MPHCGGDIVYMQGDAVPNLLVGPERFSDIQ